MRHINSKELRKIQIEILNIFTDYCKENKIKYFLCGGTLIGAIRHQGYIPWDDDIDVALLRPDYEKFVANFNEYNSLYKVYEYNNTEWYPYPFAKVSFENSILKERIDELPVNLGINIDVFPIDILPKEEVEQTKLMNNIRRQRNILNLKLIKINSDRAFYKNTILYLGKLLYKFKTTRSLLSNIIKLATEYRYSDSHKSGIIVWGYGNREIVPSYIFREVLPMEFEGKYYDVPIGYHEWLTSVYGKYMELPPIEKQVSHHAFEAFLKE